MKKSKWETLKPEDIHFTKMYKKNSKSPQFSKSRNQQMFGIFPNKSLDHEMFDQLSK